MSKIGTGLCCEFTEDRTDGTKSFAEGNGTAKSFPEAEEKIKLHKADRLMLKLLLMKAFLQGIDLNTLQINGEKIDEFSEKTASNVNVAIIPSYRHSEKEIIQERTGKILVFSLKLKTEDSKLFSGDGEDSR